MKDALRLDQISVDTGVQQRVGLDADTIDAYADVVRDGGELPPVMVFRNAHEYWLADGFHRFAAYQQLDRQTIPVDLELGTRRDALKFALGSNADHGLRRTRADKRRAVATALADPEWSELSDRQIAAMCNVHHQLVGIVRRDVDDHPPDPDDSDDGDLPNDERAEGDGYWTPDATAIACVRWLVQTLELPAGFDAIEPAVGGGAWVRALRMHRPDAVVDRLDIDGDAPGLNSPGLGSAGVGDWLTTEQVGQRRAWDVCLGNPPYEGDLVPWFEASLARADMVAYLLRETITGTETRIGWWLAHRPAWIAKVVPRPKWEGPGKRDTSDFADSILVVWVRGWEEPTRFDWIRVSG